MDHNGPQWIPMDPNEYIWILTDPNESQYIPIDHKGLIQMHSNGSNPNGFQWIPMGKMNPN